MKLRAPAKVNFHLTIREKRADGFHEIETLMVPISLADEISVELRDGDSVELTCSNPDVPLGEENLVVKAARVFARHTGKPAGAKILIEKNVPMGAGLGGGSSDAASVLLALDALHGTALGTATLEKLAGELGSDIPFFIRAVPAICKGRGEIIEPCEVPGRWPLLLLKPDFGVPTPWAYKNWMASREIPGVPYEAQDLDSVPIVNSLERPVFEKFLLLPAMKTWLVAQPEVRVAAMSGSGSTMFAVLRDARDAEALSARAKAHYGETLWTAACTAPSLEADR